MPGLTSREKLEAAANELESFADACQAKGTTTPADVAKLNELSARAKVQARQELRIPSPSASALPAVTAARPSVAAGRPATGKSARTSSVASASDGMTFTRYPPLIMFGEIEVRNVE